MSVHTALPCDLSVPDFLIDFLKSGVKRRTIWR